ETTRALGSDIGSTTGDPPARGLAGVPDASPDIDRYKGDRDRSGWPRRRVRGRTAQRFAGRFVASARPVTGHAGLGDASAGSATGVPPADRFDSCPAAWRSDGQPATARRVAARDAVGDVTAGDAAYGHVTSGNAAIGDVPSRDAIIGDPAPGDATSRTAAPRGIAASESDPTGSGGVAPFPDGPT